MFRTVGDQVSLWEAVLPGELLKLPDELARVDGLLDDPVFFAPGSRHGQVTCVLVRAKEAEVVTLDRLAEAVRDRLIALRSRL